MAAARLRVVDFLPKEAVIPRLLARTKAELLVELAEHTAKVQGVDVGELLRVLHERERLGSTGIGDGVAIPHGTLNSLPHLVATFGRSVEGVDFDAVDGKPSHLFFVLLTPDNHGGLQALARVARLMRRPEFRAELLTATDREELYRMISEEDQRL